MAVVVPHTHWDREWYAPFETMRFFLVRFLDELVDVLEREPDLVFLLDGQSVLLEDYLEIRRDQGDRVRELVAAGRLRPGPFYVQPDEFHVSGEALVRNLAIGIRVAQDFGWVVREGYLPDTFGHVHQLPQILRGFSIETFYAMRGFGVDVDAFGAEFWWEAPDGSRVLVNWLSESYSNAAILTGDAERMALHHGALVHYDTLHELLDQLAARSPSGVLLLLNGGDHIGVQAGVPGMVSSLDGAVATQLRLGGLEEFHALVEEHPAPNTVIRGELRHGWRHDVFDGICSTRTPLKAVNARVEALVSGAAERLATLATLVDGGSSADFLRYLWRELVKNYAHDSICGCSIDAVHDEMLTRFAKIAQLATAVTDDAVARLADATAPPAREGEIPIVVVNPSAFVRSGRVEAKVVADLDVPLGQRRFGWTQAEGVKWSDYRMVDPHGQPVAFQVDPADGVTVVDTLRRRKEVFADRVRFVARDVAPLSTAQYRLVPAERVAAPVALDGRARLHPRTLTNDVLSVEIEPDGTLSLTNRASGQRLRGLLELLDDGDAGDEYSFGPLPSDTPYSSRDAAWSVEEDPATLGLVAQTTLVVPAGLEPGRRSRTAATVELPVLLRLHLDEASGRLDIAVTVDNRARDHRLRLRFPVGFAASESVAESAFGLVPHSTRATDSEGWRDRPSGVNALRRFVLVRDRRGGLQVLTEGLHEYALDDEGRLDVTLLRSVGWLSRVDHPLRSHKIGPELPTPGAQCLGTHTFRLAVRPFGADEGTGAMYRQAEQFSVPLRACAVQGRRGRDGGAALGLELDPEAVVLSALKTAEDDDGIVLRVFNSAEGPCAAVVRTATGVTAASRCDLEERNLQPLEPEPGGSLTIPLRGGEIATVRLHVASGAGTKGA